MREQGRSIGRPRFIPRAVHDGHAYDAFITEVLRVSNEAVCAIRVVVVALSFDLVHGESLPQILFGTEKVAMRASCYVWVLLGVA